METWGVKNRSNEPARQWYPALPLIVPRKLMWALGLVAVAAVSAPAYAHLQLAATANADYEYNSNVFDLPSGAANGALSGADRYLIYGVQASLEELLSQQDFFLRASDNEYRYDHFSGLDHNEYRVDGGWNWKFGDQWSGVLEVLRSYSMVPFAELEQTVLSMQTEQRESARISYLFQPHWRLDFNGYTHTALEPLVTASNLKLTESEGDMTLEYLGISHLSGGVNAGYLSGAYSDVSAAQFAPDYHQVYGGLVANYEVSGHSNLGAQIGYSDRVSQAAVNSVSGYTGEIIYRNQITGKTSLSVSASRLINVYLANAGSEIDTVGNVNVTWQATIKTGFTLGYQYTYRDMPDQGEGLGVTRIDHEQDISVNVQWQPRQWLTIRPYADIQVRHSDLVGARYNASIYGLKASLQLQ